MADTIKTPTRVPAADLVGMVRDFHHLFELPAPSTPALPDASDPKGLALRHLRMRTLLEEIKEYVRAEEAGDLANASAELCDIIYFAIGTMVTYGVPVEAVFAEIHRANMSKLGADGRPLKREDGKVIKGPLFRKEDVASIMREAGATEGTPASLPQDAVAGLLSFMSERLEA